MPQSPSPSNPKIGAVLLDNVIELSVTPELFTIPTSASSPPLAAGLS